MYFISTGESKTANIYFELLAKTGNSTQMIGGCHPRTYVGSTLSNLYWQKLDFEKR